MPLTPRWRVTISYRKSPQRRTVQVRVYESGALTDQGAVQVAMEEYAGWRRTEGGKDWVLKDVSVIAMENLA